MKQQIKIAEIKTKKEMLDQYLLIKQLNTNLKKTDYERMLTEMIAKSYRMVGAFNGKKCVGLAGVWINTKLYCDKYIEPDNVIIDKNHRSKGIGKLLMQWIYDEGKKLRCKVVVLDAYIESEKAHKFYFNEGFMIRGFHFFTKIT